MAESDSAEITMAESSNLMSKTRDLLATPSHEGLAFLVDQLITLQETDEYQTVRTLYDFCVSHFPNCLTLMLLKVYRHSSNEDVVRFRSIYRLSETITELRVRGFKLSLIALHDIKPLLISCLTMPKARKSDTKILRIIVSFVAYNVLVLGNEKWDELSDCILSLANTDPLRAFNFFLDLPLVYGEFIDRFQEILVKKVYNILHNPQKDRAEDWILALETAVKLGIQLLGSDMRLALTREILSNVLDLADKLVRNGMEQFLERGIEALEQFLAKDTNRSIYSTAQCGFVAEFAFKIAGIGAHSEVAAKKIYGMVTKLEKHVENPAFKLSPPLIEKQRSERDLYNNFKAFSLVDILRYIASTEMDDSSREIAMRRLHVSLCDHTLRKAEINVSEMRKLKPLLLSCLGEVGIPENTFKILGQVVFHVAHEMFSNQGDEWFELWDYIGSLASKEFENVVYIFQCLTMMLDDKDVVIPAIDRLVPEIIRRLNHPPTELLVDKSSWVLAFTGGFCAAIHLVDVKSHAGIVKKIAYKMIESVGELVKRRMEVGIVRRGFRDMESIVKKQVDWYDTCNYKFVKGLLWRLCGIAGLRMESKIVLWRINVILEREVQEELKVLPKNELDWLNQ